jgi:hypothetical protein
MVAGRLDHKTPQTSRFVHMKAAPVQSTQLPRWQQLDFLGGQGSDRRGMGTNLNIDELRRLEQLCLEQAAECVTAEGRAALLSMAADYRAAADQAARVVGRRH